MQVYKVHELADEKNDKNVVRFGGKKLEISEKNDMHFPKIIQKNCNERKIIEIDTDISSAARKNGKNVYMST